MAVPIGGSELGIPKLSVVIPAYNESKRIGRTLELLADYFSKCGYPVEVIVVDDGSVDNTFDIARSFESKFPELRVIRNERNLGKGGAVKRGILSAKGEFRLFYDADGSTPIDEVDKIWRYFDEGCDVVIASRALKESKLEPPQPFLRRFLGFTFRWLVWIFVVSGFKDTQCGFKAFTARAAEELFRRQLLMRFGFDVELIFLAKRLGFKVKEMPVVWRDSSLSTVKLPRDGVRMLKEIVSVRLNHIFGRYKL